MAYTANEYRVVVRGGLNDGAESWYNTWSVLDVATGQDPNDLATLFHSLYSDVALRSASSHTSYVGATAKNLNTGVITELFWEDFVGDDLADPMPSQVAVRVSLTGPGNVNGGPFLPGWSKNAGDENGLFQFAAGVASDVSDFVAALEAADWELRIDRPTINSTVAVIGARVGQRFDVIRKRANDIAESYATVTLP